MNIVCDANVTVNSVLDFPIAPKLTSLINNAAFIVVPDLYICEVTNVFWKYHQFQAMGLQECERGIDKCLTIPDSIISGTTLAEEAFSLACLSRHSVYDCFYLVCARRHNATLLTMDKALVTAGKKYNIKVEMAG